MEGFALYFGIIYILFTINVFLFLLCLLKILNKKVSIVILLLCSVVIVALIDQFVKVNLFPFASIKNAFITLGILVLVHTDMVIFKEMQKDGEKK
jgi:hypothetical protein